VLTLVSSMDKNADVQVYDSSDQTGFTILDHNRRYFAKWNSEEINKDEFDEGDNINYSFRSYMFTEDSRWINTQLLNPRLLRTSRENYNRGSVMFRQTITQSSPFTFKIFVVSVVKQTANLEVMYTSSILTFIPKVDGEKSAKKYCDLWSKQATQILFSNDLNNCPCHLNSVQSNSVLDPTCKLSHGNCVDGNQCYIMG